MRIGDWSSDVCSSDLVDIVPPRQLARLRIGADVEADDEAVRGAGQRHVRLGDAADRRMQHADLRLVGRYLLERADDRLDGALHVALDDDRQLRDLAGLDLVEHLLERAARARSDEHTSELKPHMRNSYAGSCSTKTTK